MSRRLWNEVKEVLFPKSLPNPEWYREAPQRPPLRKTIKHVVPAVRGGLRAYLASFRTEAAPAAAETDVREEVVSAVSSVQDALRRRRAEKYDERDAERATQELLTDARDGAANLRALVQSYMAVYRETLSAFMDGYAQGLRGDTAPVVAGAKQRFQEGIDRFKAAAGLDADDAHERERAAQREEERGRAA